MELISRITRDYGKLKDIEVTISDGDEKIKDSIKILNPGRTMKGDCPHTSFKIVGRNVDDGIISLHLERDSTSIVRIITGPYEIETVMGDLDIINNGRVTFICAPEGSVWKQSQPDEHWSLEATKYLINKGGEIKEISKAELVNKKVL